MALSENRAVLGNVGRSEIYAGQKSREAGSGGALNTMVKGVTNTFRTAARWHVPIDSRSEPDWTATVGRFLF
jgi:hypothetical protein